ncbi:MAG: radical SAM protein [Candidatus Omnitrophica bacterium]|nr:radical SAM protein [Candidatus Omnitrophota bacterium]MDD5652616.1 radical SAM protein [Candidatus Omnitrophota bacterium]
MKNESYVSIVNASAPQFSKGSGPVLGWLDIELTERCNNNCVHCCINLSKDDPAAKKRELSTQRIEEILKEAADLGCMTVRFTGGEPFLREDFKELYIFARRLGLKVMIFTNATLITPKWIELFKHIPPMEKMEVTVYGMKEKSYEAVTQVKGSYAAAFRGINLLWENKVPFVVKGALLNENKNEIEEFEAWSKKIPWMDNRPPSYSMFFDLRCRRDAKSEQIKKLRLSAEEGLGVLTRKKDEYIKGMQEFCSKFMRASADNLFSCGSGNCSGCVDAYGFFQPCMMLRHPQTTYDLSKGTLEDAVTNFFPKVRQIRAKNKDYLDRCARCFLKGLCEQCPAKSWSEYGTLDTPSDYLCQIAHAQARFLGLVGEDERAWEVENWKERIDNLCARKI